MVIIGYDDRRGCGYVVTTGADMPRALPGMLPVAMKAGRVSVNVAERPRHHFSHFGRDKGGGIVIEIEQAD